MIHVTGGSFYWERDSWLRIDAKVGRYILYSELEGGRKHGLSVYGTMTAKINEVQGDHNKMFLNQVYNLELAKRELVKPDFAKLGYDIIFYCGCRCGSDEDDHNLEHFMYDVIENIGENDMKLVIGHKTFWRNCELLPPHSGATYEVFVPAGKSVSIVKKQPLLMEGFDMSLHLLKRIVMETGKPKPKYIPKNLIELCDGY